MFFAHRFEGQISISQRGALNDDCMATSPEIQVDPGKWSPSKNGAWKMGNFTFWNGSCLWGPGNSAGDLFGMVIRDPFKGCWWPPTGGWKGHIESPGICSFSGRRPGARGWILMKNHDLCAASRLKNHSFYARIIELLRWHGAVMIPNTVGFKPKTSQHPKAYKLTTEKVAWQAFAFTSAKSSKKKT